MLAVLLILSCSGFAQNPASRRAVGDSLAGETVRARDLVDSLRRSAMRQDTIIESMTRLVDFYEQAGDSANTKAWRNTLDRYMSKFDSTLAVLDSAIGRLKVQSDRLDKLLNAKNNPSSSH